jgi:hypothetical protein
MALVVPMKIVSNFRDTLATGTYHSPLLLVYTPAKLGSDLDSTPWLVPEMKLRYYQFHDFSST